MSSSIQYKPRQQGPCSQQARWCMCPHEVLYDSLKFAAATSFFRCCRRAEAVSGLVFDSHQLVHNGEVLSGKSLAEYGVQKGSVLELVPYEPFVPETMPEGSPLLSSPAHELVISPATCMHLCWCFYMSAQQSCCQRDKSPCLYMHLLLAGLYFLHHACSTWWKAYLSGTGSRRDYLYVCNVLRCM